MRPLYENVEDDLEVYRKKSKHDSPHLHKSLELIYVNKGTLEVGIMHDLYHMEEGDFAIVFPDLIHHFQVFDENPCRSTYILANPSLTGAFLNTLQQYAPKNPVIKKENLHRDIVYAMKSISSDSDDPNQNIINQAVIQIVLARTLPLLELVSKSTFESDDIVERTVSYVASHFTETITLTDMAYDLGVSPYALSRIFSKTFHQNFNQYINDVRLEHAVSLLQYSSQSITDIYLNAGFESQRTFNRVFKERYHMSPREYRTELLAQNENSEGDPDFEF